MTENEMYEFAAKAANVKIDHYRSGAMVKVVTLTGHYYIRWDPRHNDGDALRLAVLLGFVAPGCWPDCSLLVLKGMDWLTATREAIFQAAVQAGRRMP